LAAAVFAWSFQYLRGRRVLQLWGAQNARLIRVEAERIEMLTLAPPDNDFGDENAKGQGVDDAPSSIVIDGVPQRITGSKEIAGVHGMIHARQALIDDGSFLWDQQRGDCRPEWACALRFSRGGRTATVLFDMHCGFARLLETGHEAAIEPEILKGWQTFLDEQRAVKSEDS